MPREFFSDIRGRAGGVRQKIEQFSGRVEEPPGPGSCEEVLIRPSSIADTKERFVLWCGIMGIVQDSVSGEPLDGQLADVPELRDEIYHQLDELAEALDDLLEISGATKEPRDAIPRTKLLPLEQNDDDDSNPNGADDENNQLEPSEVDEVDTLLEVISECISSLFRMASLANLPYTVDCFARAWLVDRKHDDGLPAAEEIDFIGNRFPKLLEDGSMKLLHRLASAMKQRRVLIDSGLGRRTQADDGQQKKIQQRTGTEMYDSEDEGTEEDVSTNSDIPITDPLTGVSLPSLADLSGDQNAFECPICFTNQKFSRESSWRSHAMHDLGAYVCTVGDQRCENKLFGSRDTWFEHELRYHRIDLGCVICGKKHFQNKTEVRSHIITVHGSFSESQLEALVDAGQDALGSFPATDCPFCNNWDGMSPFSLENNPLSIATSPNCAPPRRVNPDYILIKRWVPEWEQDALWKHTRELREKRDLRRIYEGDGASFQDQLRRVYGVEGAGGSSGFKKMNQPPGQASSRRHDPDYRNPKPAGFDDDPYEAFRSGFRRVPRTD
ncbi:ankyrin repeat protein [Colletotrichum sojae]|uniref:Ankyrin repeat protein n=1 Tax=Colletotrichum sojae TaxID=2175907 RepID=A0A8H6JTL9_9PEZI|nr:ankyrin repeat protein [Colletotrichum sojae]